MIWSKTLHAIFGETTDPLVGLQKSCIAMGQLGSRFFNQFQEMGVQFHKGLPDNMEALCTPETRPGLIIMDDLMHVSSKSSQVTNLLTKGTHHLDLFAISLLQNLFHSGREQAGQNRNYHYTVLFKNPADTRYIKRPTLGPEVT